MAIIALASLLRVIFNPKSGQILELTNNVVFKNSWHWREARGDLPAEVKLIRQHIDLNEARSSAIVDELKRRGWEIVRILLYIQFNWAYIF